MRASPPRLAAAAARLSPPRPARRSGYASGPSWEADLPTPRARPITSRWPGGQPAARAAPGAAAAARPPSPSSSSITAPEQPLRHPCCGSELNWLERKHGRVILRCRGCARGHIIAAAHFGPCRRFRRRGRCVRRWGPGAQHTDGTCKFPHVYDQRADYAEQIRERPETAVRAVALPDASRSRRPFPAHRRGGRERSRTPHRRVERGGRDRSRPRARPQPPRGERVGRPRSRPRSRPRRSPRSWSSSRSTRPRRSPPAGGAAKRPRFRRSRSDSPGRGERTATAERQDARRSPPRAGEDARRPAVVRGWRVTPKKGEVLRRAMPVAQGHEGGARAGGVPPARPAGVLPAGGPVPPATAPPTAPRSRHRRRRRRSSSSSSSSSGSSRPPRR
eukprot:TRINITY_DN12747_c0_g1_i1.p1 TRINITY_DN12747_c0_g1~~TRINITY_DN12747_c0_g1_i1.p1  ORF type:complete len:390 (+),score=26.01 TRINITY_DN12747_c0_g1_i1:91-1260(+)